MEREKGDVINLEGRGAEKEPKWKNVMKKYFNNVFGRYVRMCSTGDKAI